MGRQHLSSLRPTDTVAPAAPATTSSPKATPAAPVSAALPCSRSAKTAKSNATARTPRRVLRVNSSAPQSTPDSPLTTTADKSRTTNNTTTAATAQNASALQQTSPEGNAPAAGATPVSSSSSAAANADTLSGAEHNGAGLSGEFALPLSTSQLMPMMQMQLTENKLQGPEHLHDAIGVKVLPIAYALSLLAQLLPIPLHVFDSNGHYLKRLDQGDDDNWNVLHTDKAYRKELITAVKEQHITLFTQERPVLLGGVAVADNLILIVGPVVTTTVDSNFTQLFAAKHQASNVVLQECTPAKLASMLLLIYSSLTGEKISLTSFLDRYFMQDQLMQQAMNKAADIFYHETVMERPHNPISFERDIIDAVKQGDENALIRALNSPFASMRGTLAKDRLRSQKNLAIVDITIASRALIDTGFSAEETFITTDAFIRNVEESKDCEEVTALARACAVYCTKMVQKQREEAKHKSAIQNPIVQQACDYIDRHAFAKLDVKAIAEHLNVSVGYLSKLFKREQHLTMSDYMRKRKIELATMMLANTEQSIDEIALSLSFCSQSHFGAVFQREMGCTPASYRKQVRLQSGNLHMA